MLTQRLRPLFFAVCVLSGMAARGQTYNPTTCCTVSNKGYGPAQAVSTDGRSWFYDATNFVMRDYNGTTEVLSYLNLAKYRSGHFPIFVHSGGTLQGNGVWLGGTTLVYWFKDSTGDANLVRWYTDSTGNPGGPFFAVANHLSEGNAGLIKGTLSLDNVDNTSDATKNAATVALTNHTIDANNNTLLHIPNSALSNNSIGLSVTSNAGSDISVTTTPAALGSSLVVNMPDAGVSSRGPLKSTDWVFFHGKLDSVRISNDSVYNCVNGTCTLQSVIVAGGAVNSVNGTNTTLLFSPTTGNVLGQVNQNFNFNWGGQHAFGSFAPIFSTLTTAGGIFYGNGSGQLLQSAAGTSGQIFQSNGGTAPSFFTPTAGTVNGWLGYTALSNSLGSTHIFVGNGSNVATDVAVTGAISLTNTGVSSLTANSVATSNIQNSAVTLPKLANGRANSLVGFDGSGSPGAFPSTKSVYFAPPGSGYNPEFMILASGIVFPFNSYVFHDSIQWQLLGPSAGHGSSFYDSVYGLQSSGALYVAFPTVKYVFNTTITVDESFSGRGVILGPSTGFNFFAANVYNSKSIGAILSGNGSTTWQNSQSSADFSKFTISAYNTGNGVTFLDVSSSTGVSNYDPNAIQIQYAGTHNYHINRIFSGLGGYTVGFQLVDSSGAGVTSAPTTADNIMISNGGMFQTRINMWQYDLTNTWLSYPPYNFWIIGLYECWMVASAIDTTAIRIKWQTNYPSATTYKIYRDTSPGFGTQVLIHTGTEGVYNDTGLSANTQYYYKEVAVVSGIDTFVTTFPCATITNL